MPRGKRDHWSDDTLNQAVDALVLLARRRRREAGRERIRRRDLYTVSLHLFGNRWRQPALFAALENAGVIVRAERLDRRGWWYRVAGHVDDVRKIQTIAALAGR